MDVDLFPAQLVLLICCLICTFLSGCSLGLCVMLLSTQPGRSSFCFSARALSLQKLELSTTFSWKGFWHKCLPGADAANYSSNGSNSPSGLNTTQWRLQTLVNTPVCQHQGIDKKLIMPSMLLETFTHLLGRPEDSFPS